MRKDERGSVIDYLRVSERIPRDSQRDPHFTKLRKDDFCDLCNESGKTQIECKCVAILEVFSAEEVCLMVNRFLYQIEYQRDFHRRMERKRTEDLKPLKQRVKEMFQLKSWSQATEEQIQAAVESLRQEALNQNQSKKENV